MAMARSEPADRGDKPRPKRASMLRTFVLADFITLANAACGTAAILCCAGYLVDGERARIWTSIVLLAVALVADAADGAVARWRRKSSMLGADLDSLADIVSFGVAPAVLAFALGMRGLWDSCVLIYFVCCGISRLARFNATAAAMMTDKGKVSHFEGTPIPTSLLLVAVLAVAFGRNDVHQALWLGEISVAGGTFHPLTLLYALSGTLMASATLKIPKP